jgi:hypothetical protein
MVKSLFCPLIVLGSSAALNSLWTILDAGIVEMFYQNVSVALMELSVISAWMDFT